MKLGPLHHVAIAVPHIEEALPFFRDTLGFLPERIHEIGDQRVRVLFLGDKGQRIELLEPTDADSGVDRPLFETIWGALHPWPGTFRCRQRGTRGPCRG